jgi:hypothetical protein
MILFCISLVLSSFEDYQPLVSSAETLAAKEFVAALGTRRKKED